ncbi:protein kinase domain-containing protein [Prosthecobacter sp.]|uniref:protein kinase domain-containing protein n=1 Tax=Prosthecobacter sp. TaxID=1965333 RepID=UPI0037837098
MNENPQRPAAAGGAGWTPPAPDHLEAILPQYDQWEMIGCGGMGAVYKARQISLDRLVAIKVLPPQVAEGEAEYITRFKNEARTMAKVNHPAIVAVYDFGETRDGLLYIVMEYIDGTDVFKMIHAQGKLPVEHALAITAHVCDALAYAHEHGVIHRDIKPANILINMEGAVKVADFGLASVHDPSQGGFLTEEGTTMGTPDYVAPEVLIIGMPVDGRADLYAVGVMLYNMLTGKIPRGSFQLPSEKIGCDKRYDAIVLKAMEHDLSRRYQTAREIRRDLDQILTVPVAKAKPARQAPQGGMQPRLPPPPPPKPPTPWGMIAAAVIVLAGGAAFFLRPSEAPPAASGTTAEAPRPADENEPGTSKPVPPPAGKKPALAVTPGTAVPSVNPRAPKGSPWSTMPVMEFKGHFYQLVGEGRNQADAQKHALSLGAHLATINSQEEQDWMDKTMPPFLKQVSLLHATLGGVREKGVWKWVTDEAFEYTHWNDPAAATADPEKKLILKLDMKGPALTHWGVGSEAGGRAFLLEWDGPPSQPVRPAVQPPPVAESEGAKRLRELDTSFHAALERDVLAVHRTALADLNTKYLAALERAQSAAMTSAHLEEALALREEKQRISSQSPLPAEDESDLPATLKTLRATYRNSLRPIESARLTGINSLFQKYEDVLKGEQAEWTKASKLEDAQLASARLASLGRERADLFNEARELLPGGKEVVLEKPARFTTAGSFKPPVEFTLVVKTRKDDLRLAYTAKQLIFNWETNPSELRIDSDPGGAHHLPGLGRIPEDTFVTIHWRILPHMQSISVDGKRRFLHFGDYSRVNNPLEIFPFKHPVTIKSVKAKVLDLQTLEDQVSSAPQMREPLLNKAVWTGKLTIPAGTYRPLRRIDIGAAGRNNAQNDEQRGDVVSQPGMRIENVRFHLREGSWQGVGGRFQDVKITADLGGSFAARDSVFQDCIFAKEGVWYIALFSSKWHFTNCVITGSFMQNWKLGDVGMKLESCTLQDIDLNPVLFKEDASEEVGKDWLTIQNCRFINCRVPESFALATKNCVFEKCTFGEPEPKLLAKAPLDAVIYVQDCTNQPKTGTGRSIEVHPASEFSGNTGASLPFVFTNGRLDFQNPPR